ncbi:hypothetical protein HU200_059034 [Digitaria exilis]|uniref:Uncharacterized protein n=1 Tax=Digitaria exilis TaxID=1010633 RepID=A0A835AIF3_9POAL|nr:hypothetical protein HU200_059034 [Digitaria exilis]
MRYPRSRPRARTPSAAAAAACGGRSRRVVTAVMRNPEAARRLATRPPENSRSTALEPCVLPPTRGHGRGHAHAAT